MKVGLLGGLFDPPHLGHLIITQSVADEFCLDKIIFIPAFNPPHKSRYSPFSIRYKMTALAIASNKIFIISDIEKQIPGKTYTIEVIRKLKKQIEGNIYLIIGSDQWQEIETWKNPVQLFKEIGVIVVRRPNYEIEKTHRFYRKILISHSPLIDISSTQIRKKVKHKKNIQYLVPPRVFNYIKKHKLYR
jgi:nicotinate-nucleotide adenylyltransferase